MIAAKVSALRKYHLFIFLKVLLESVLPNAMVECAELLLHVWKVAVSDFTPETGYP
jgi:hypothetical protein